MRGELVSHFRWIVSSGDHVATADIHFVSQGQRHRLPGRCNFQRTIRAQHLLDRGAARRRQHHHRVTHAHLATGDGAGEATEILIGAIDPLHRQAQAAGRIALTELHRVQVFDQARAGIPRHQRRTRGQVLPFQRR
ncbi:hypothetical protein D3C81_1580620 [compost metagenome]